MKFIRLVAVIWACFGGASSLYAQAPASISGIVKDNFNEPLIGATIGIYNGDGKFVTGTGAETDGSFILTDLPQGNYVLQISYLGYEDYKKPVVVGSDPVVLGLIKMSTIRTTTLDEVAITGRAVAVQQDGDTTAFNAGSFKVNPDATAEDLLRKMPGMDMSGGSPKAQGEQITKVLVDGKPFFGDDANASLKNLPAEIIDKVQVYDEKSEQAQFTGFDDGNTTKTVNIITKPDKKRGVFGKVYGGYGYEDKYSGGGNVNYFEGDRRISIIGLTNNVNIQNFSDQDLVGVSGGRRGRRGHGSRDNNFMTDPQGGISTTNAVGINYSDQWGKKIEVTGSYFFNNSHNVADQTINRIYVLPDQLGQRYQESSLAQTENFNHRFNLRLNYTIDSSNSILFIPRISTQTNNSYATVTGQTLQGGEVLNQTSNSFRNDLSAYRLAGIFLYRHKFKKPGRTFSLWADGDTKGGTGTGFYQAENMYEDASLNDTLDQYARSATGGWEIDVNVNYTEPINEKSGIQLRYNIEVEGEDADKRTFNYNTGAGDYADLDTLMSNVFETEYLTHKTGLSYRFSDKNLRLGAGINFQNARLTNVRSLPDAQTFSRTFNNWLPFVFVRQQFSKQKELHLFYRARTDAPSVDQLQDIIDNQNPLQLSTGDPNLNPALEHRLRLRYRTTNPEVSSTFFLTLSGTYTRDYIGRNTLIAAEDMYMDNGMLLPKGAQLIRPANLDGYWNISSFATYGRPVPVLKSNVNVNVQAGFERTPGMVNQSLNMANNTSLGAGLTISSNISEKIDFTISSMGSGNWVKNTLNQESDNRFYNQNSRLSANIMIWKGIVFNTELNHQLYAGLSQGYNQNFLLWNMSIGKKLFKKQQGELKLSVFDLLGQNQSIQRTVSEIYSQDMRTNVLQRYFMLTFTYNLRYFGGNASMEDARHSPRQPHSGWH